MRESKIVFFIGYNLDHQSHLNSNPLLQPQSLIVCVLFYFCTHKATLKDLQPLTKERKLVSAYLCDESTVSYSPSPWVIVNYPGKIHWQFVRLFQYAPHWNPTIFFLVLSSCNESLITRSLTSIPSLLSLNYPIQGASTQASRGRAVKQMSNK